MKSIREADIKPNTKVLVRCDLDVSFKNNLIVSTFRLDKLLPTLAFLLSKDTRIIICGHIGRPDGKYAENLSTKKLFSYFNEKLGAGSFELLENLRFSPGEEENDPDFAKELSSKADIFVNESFATCTRKHASIVKVPKFLPSYAGLRLEEETKVLSKVVKNPKRPLVVIIGGAKLESKKPLISKFVNVADKVLVGGKLAFQWADILPENLFFPVDYAFDNKDIGKRTIEEFSQLIQLAATVVWAGPLGIYEDDNYINGTRSVAKAIVASKAFSVVGGGDTVAALEKLSLLDKFGFISTGGSAMLDFFVNKNLPGLEALGYNG